MYSYITSEPRLSRGTDEGLCQPAGIETLAHGARVSGLVLDDRRAERLEPSDRVVKLVPNPPLEELLAVRALRSEVLPLAVPPHDAAREQHRAARTRPLLEQQRLGAELAQPRRGGEAGHPCACNRYRNENVGLCSTYSMRTRSGPQTKTARVLAASTTLSTTPISSASAMCSSTESTRTARWLSSGFSGSPGSPGWNSTYAPPTSTRGCPSGDGGAG